MEIVDCGLWIVDCGLIRRRVGTAHHLCFRLIRRRVGTAHHLCFSHFDNIIYVALLTHILQQLAELLIPKPLGTHEGHPYRLICSVDVGWAASTIYVSVIFDGG
jgi:hypothetical protein